MKIWKRYSPLMTFGSKCIHNFCTNGMQESLTNRNAEKLDKQKCRKARHYFIGNIKQLRSQALTETTQRDMKSLSENFSQVEKKLSWRTVWEVWTQEFLVLYWKAWFNPRLTKIPLSKEYFCLVGQVTRITQVKCKGSLPQISRLFVLRS